MNKKDNKIEEVVENTTNEIQSDERYEKLGFWGTIKRTFTNLFLDIKSSFVYNKMKLPAILIGIPGVLLGFFISFHYNIISNLRFISSPDKPHSGLTIYSSLSLGSNDYSAICFFILMLLGILNLFTAVSCSSKKNLSSVVTATVSTVLMAVFVVIYFLYIFTSISYGNQGVVQIPTGSSVSLGSLDFIMVMISCIGSVISSALGCILGFINYDRTYKKSDSR